MKPGRKPAMVAIVDGVQCWTVRRASLLEMLDRLGWTETITETGEQLYHTPAGVSVDAAVRRLSDSLDVLIDHPTRDQIANVPVFERYGSRATWRYRSARPNPATVARDIWQAQGKRA